MKIFVFILFTFIAGCLGAQTTGKIVNTAREPVGYANVVFSTKADTSFLAGTITNEKGIFVVPEIAYNRQDEIQVRISCLGYQTQQINFSGLGKEAIVLQEDTLILDEVVVKASKQPYKMEQGVLSANVENSPLSRLGTANDVLGKLPLVTGKDGAFTVFGKGTPLIYINRRKVRDKSELMLLTSKEIKEITIQTTPDTEYDATVGAVIQITTLRPEGEGWSGSLYTLAGQGAYFNGFVSASLNYRVKKWDFFISSAYNRDNRKNRSEQQQAFKFDGREVKYASLQKQHIQGNNYFPALGINFMPNAHHSLGVSYKGVFAHTTLPSTLDITTLSYQATNAAYQKQTSLNKNDNHQHVFNGYYSGRWNDRFQLDITADAVTGAQELAQHTSFEGETNAPIHIASEASFDVYSGKVVMEYTPTVGTFRWGAEYIHTSFAQSYHIDRTDLGLNDESNQSLQNRFSAFASYRTRMNAWRLNAGLRYEHIKGRYYSTETLRKDQSPEYNYFFPSLSLSYEPTGYQMTLSYLPRITYPSYTQLRNFAQYVSPFIYESGNPDLKSVLRHVAQLSFMWKNLLVMSSYSLSKRTIYPLMYVHENQPVILRVYDNLSTMNTANLVASYSLEVGIWKPAWEVGVSKQWLKMARLTYNTPRWNYTWQNSFTLPLGYTLRIDFVGSSKGHGRLSYYNKHSASLDVNLSKSFGLWDVRLDVNDLLRTAGQRWDTLFDSIRWSEDKYYDSRSIQISLSFRFNSTNQRYKGQTENDEINRIH